MDKRNKRICITINKDMVDKYHIHYFNKYPRRKKPPIKSPIPPSLNQWMIMPRHQMNAEKQKWKEFGTWLITEYEYNNLLISKCNVTVVYYFPTRHKHDADNYSPKFLFDGFTEAGLFVDDNFEHIKSVTVKECEGRYDRRDPMVKFYIDIINEQKESV